MGREVGVISKWVTHKAAQTMIGDGLNVKNTQSNKRKPITE